MANLSYGTHRQNMADKRRDGTWQGGEQNPAAKLTWETVREIRQRLAGGEAGITLAHEYSVCVSSISNIWTGKTWREEVVPG